MSSIASLIVEPKPLRGYPGYLRAFFWHQKRRYGQLLLPSLLWARVPRLFVPLALLYGAIDRRGSPIEPRLRSLITVRVSQINWCRFCVDINAATLVTRGVSQAKLADLVRWRQSPLFDERERVALRYAEAMTITGSTIDDDLVAALKGHFTDTAVIELTALIAFQNLSSKFNAALRVPPQGFCKLPTIDAS